MEKDEEVVYRIVAKKRREHKSLDGIKITKDLGDGQTTRIGLVRWNNWNTSFRVTIEDNGKQIYLDSGVIEELAEEIRRLKKLSD